MLATDRRLGVRECDGRRTGAWGVAKGDPGTSAWAGPEPITEEMLQSDIDSGSPLNADGTVNLVHYAAWLVRELAANHG